MSGSIGAQVDSTHESLARMPAATVSNVRNDMYLASETIRLLQKDAAVKLDAEAANISRASRGDRCRHQVHSDCG